MKQHSKIPLFLECEVGGKSAEQLTAELEAGSFSVNEFARYLVRREAYQAQGRTQRIKFACENVRNLGFNQSAHLKDVWARIKKLGHSLCEPADGSAVRLALKGQEAPRIWCAMALIKCFQGCGRAFILTHPCNGSPGLMAQWITDIHWFEPDDEILFRL